MDLNEAKKTIRDLLNLADNDAAAAMESENALKFARRLMLRHNLTESQCEETPKSVHERAADEEYGTTAMFSQGSNLSTWELTLFNAINLLVGTVKWYSESKVPRTTPHGTIAYDGKGKQAKAAKISFYGPATDILAAVDLSETWAVTVAALARMKYGGCFRGRGRSYAEGFAYALLEKVRKIEKEELSLPHEEAAALGEGCTALALTQAKELMVAKRDHAKTWLKKEKGIELTNGGSRSMGEHHSGAWGAGRADGGKANFTRTSTKAIG